MTAFVLSAVALSLLVVALLLVPLLRTDAALAEARRTRTALLVGLSLPLAAAGGYAWSGAWSGLMVVSAPQRDAGAPAVDAGQVEGMVQRLAQRLQRQPDDAEGWRLLAHSYENLGRFAEAEQAYRQLERLLPPSAELLTEHAVTLAMSLGERLSGAPEALIERALALAGSAAFERGDYRRAVARWRQVQDAAGSDAELSASISESIRKAEALAAGGDTR
jgi:cytochrome c-type biogenesis protein CcmH